jgi:predicted esterase
MHPTMAVSRFSRLFFISLAPVQAFVASGVGILMQNRLSSSTVDSCEGESASFRILCLHGKGGNGEEFLERLLPLRTLLNDRLVANNGKKRSEVSNNVVSIKWEALTAPYQISVMDDAYAWWTMSPGVRSFNADEYIGFDDSASKVIKAVFPTDSAAVEECRYDLILGHSQGAILLSALLATNIDLQRSNCSYILNGAAWPNPYENALTSLSEEQTHELKKDTRMLFVMGKRDNINPIESAKQVYGCYQTAGLDVSIIYHEGGHSLPIGGDLDSERAMGDVCDFILQTVSEKGKQIVDTTV